MKPIVAIEQAGALIAGRYRVDKLLGRGGMAIVYRVLDERTQKPLALKRSSPRDLEKRAHYGALLEREYHTLAQLAHPNIIEVYDCGVDPRGPYYTMELFDGTDLQKVDRLPWQSVCVALHDVASALAMLHSRGLLHRDVSMRNVQWTAKERAKLFDFGAMAAIGISQQVVGTPPFVAPEALQLQALDGRVDIFALGALGYRLLTGRHAFQARQFSQLRDVWRSKPASPTASVPDVPAELSALVLRMLSLDRGGRPNSAGEIIERLRAIAKLEHEDVARISRAYLTTPTLVGREAALRAVRTQILGLVRGDGSALMFRGVAGSGRTRMLDACALEGKLLGAAVVRADARDAAGGEWSVARALGKQLIAQFPKPAVEAARLARNVLGHVLEELRVEEPYATITGFTPDRSLIIRELREWFLAMSKNQRLLVVVDDLERIDEGSLALLTALAHRAERFPILLAVSSEDELLRPLPPTLQTLSDQATAIDLEQLQPLETEALMRSLFGDVANLPACAARIHSLSQGNPRATMELAQHLVATGRAGYEAGSWVLPTELDTSDLPRTLADSLLARLNALNDAARELAEALALAVDDGLQLEDYPLLCRDAARAYRALDDLVAARIVVVDRDRGYFSQGGFASVLEQAMSQERRRGLHAKIAKLLAVKARDVLRRVQHLLAAGLDSEAIELLGAVDLTTRSPSSTLLAAAVESAERLGVPASTLHHLRMSLLLSCPYVMDYENYRRVLPIVLARLEQDSGLARYRQLTDGPPNERLTQAIAQTQQAHLATPPAERVHTVIEAIRELAKLVGSVPAMAVPVFASDLHAMLPDISPLFPLSPSLPIVATCVEGTRTWGRGAYLQAREMFERMLARIAEPDRGGFDEVQHTRVMFALQNMLGTFEAAFGIPHAEERAKLADGHRDMRVIAWRIRGLYQLAIGNAVEASKCMRRAELLKAQDGLREGWVSPTAGMELILRSRLGDLLGLKSQLRTLSALAARFEGWRAVEFLGRSCYHELQGDVQTAFELILAGLELVRPLEHAFFPALAASHISLLADVGRLPEAVTAAREYIAICRQHGLVTPDVPVRAALVLARAGEYDEAVRVLEPTIEMAVQLGRVGLAAGVVYEARAKVAIEAGDRAAFEEFSERCAREFAKSENPALGARLATLFDAARVRGLSASEEVTSIGKSLEPPAASSEDEMLHSRFDECADPPDRARCALTLLLQNTVSNLGYLYVTTAEQGTALAASLPDDPADPGVGTWVQRYAMQQFGGAGAAPEGNEEETQSLEPATESVDAEMQSSEGVTESLTEDETQTSTQTMGDAPGEGASATPEYAYLDADGRYLEVVLLETGHARRRTLAGLLVVESAPTTRIILPSTLTSAIASELLHYEDAVAWPRAT